MPNKQPAQGIAGIVDLTGYTSGGVFMLSDFSGGCQVWLTGFRYEPI